MTSGSDSRQPLIGIPGWEAGSADTLAQLEKIPGNIARPETFDFPAEYERIAGAWTSSHLLPAMTFATAAGIAFFTGTSRGTYAILTPFVLPLAMGLSGDTLSPGVLLAVGASVGGALFGDHCSPVSDTTCLASFGAGSDHMDHVSTQLPYALVACVFYVAAGMLVA